MSKWCLGVILLAITLTGGSAGSGTRKLNDYIRHYEELDYSSHELHQSHQRAKRSIHNPVTELKLSTHGKNFHLKLKRDTSVFASDFKIENSDGTLEDMDTSFLVKGTVNDEAGSAVHGSILNGVFSGHFYSPTSGEWHVEPAAKYFNNEKPLKFHSVIYNVENMNMDPYRHKRAADRGAQCGNDDHHSWMEEVQRSAYVENNYRTVKRELPRDHNIYSEKYNRAKRATPSVEVPTENTCTLFLQSDQQLYTYMLEQNGMDDMRTKEAITAMFGTHVATVKDIYYNTVFSYKEKNIAYSGLTFRVQRVKINTTADCEGQKLNTNPFCATNMDVSNFLNLNSLTNHNEYCLAYVFTHRDFTGGTLGLAWVGSDTDPNGNPVMGFCEVLISSPDRSNQGSSIGASGGICERWKQYTENSATNRRVYKSLNTGIVTVVNYGQVVPSRVSSLTLAHEIGHNFGSPHDEGPSCTPYSSLNDDNGNFIMFASATSGDRANNRKFSDCSKTNISLVLQAVLKEEGGKKNCFISSDEAFCGNSIKEEGEECDCGFKEDCTDLCCNPKGTSNECKLKSNIAGYCSPSEGPCCDGSTCSYLKTEHECLKSSDCHEASSCDGSSAKCPNATNSMKNKPCNDKTQVCIDGECRGSICNSLGDEWEECFKQANLNDKNVDKSTLCYVSCKKKNDNSTGACTSSNDENLPTAFKSLLNEINDGEAIQLSPGAPCDNFQGYCDVFKKCRGVDADGPLARLKNLLFNKETFDNIKDWIIEHWWAVVLIIIGVIILMALFIKVCAVHTPSSNPKRKKARKLSLRPERHRGPPPPYPGPSQGGPPHGKGKGRGGGQKQAAGKQKGRGNMKKDQMEMGNRRV